MDTARPPQFDGINFLYYKARMACHLEAVDLGIWRVTRDGMKPIKNPENPRRVMKKNCILMLELKIACLNLLAWMFLTKYLL